MKSHHLTARLCIETRSQDLDLKCSAKTLDRNIPSCLPLQHQANVATPEFLIPSLCGASACQGAMRSRGLWWTQLAPKKPVIHCRRLCIYYSLWDANAERRNILPWLEKRLGYHHYTSSWPSRRASERRCLATSSCLPHWWRVSVPSGFRLLPSACNNYPKPHVGDRLMLRTEPEHLRRQSNFRLSHSLCLCSLCNDRHIYAQIAQG